MSSQHYLPLNVNIADRRIEMLVHYHDLKRTELTGFGGGGGGGGKSRVWFNHV